MKKIVQALICISFLTACGGGGGSVPVSGSGPNAQLVAGDTLTHGGQTFTVVEVSSDGTRMTVSAPSNGFFRSSTNLTVTLVKGDDGIFRYSVGALSIEYNPVSNVVTWAVADGTSETTLVNQVLASQGQPILPGVTVAANFNTGQASTSSATSLIEARRLELSSLVSYWSDRGKTVQANIDTSYTNINVPGLEAAHQAGWTGLGANVTIIDGFSGTVTGFGPNFVVDEIDASNLEFLHGSNVFAASFAVAPEATYSNLNYTTYFSSATPNLDTDVVNYSMGMSYFNAFSTRSGALSAAQSYSRFYHQSLGENNPNAVVVIAAGNAGDITDYSGGGAVGCEVEGNRFTVGSCSEAIASLDSENYSHLDRTIWVGSYNSAEQDLTNYSFSAGSNAMDYFLVTDGNSILDDTQGTSYAAPRVAGVTALTVQKFPHLTAQERTRLILETADDLGAPGVDPVFGHGLLNAGAALNPLGRLQ
jgi:hypothetical protein